MHHQAKFIATLACLGALPCVADYLTRSLLPTRWRITGRVKRLAPRQSIPPSVLIGVDGTYVERSTAQPAWCPPRRIPLRHSAWRIPRTSISITVPMKARLMPVPQNLAKLTMSAAAGRPRNRPLGRGGATRGLNIYVFNGQLYFHAWNATDVDVDLVPTTDSLHRTATVPPARSVPPSTASRITL